MKQCAVPVTVVSVASDERLKVDAQVEADKIVAQFNQAGIDVTGEVRVGAPSTAITECVKANGGDLVVMGSHGRTGLDRLLVGSVSERVIGSSECPVLLVKHYQSKILTHSGQCRSQYEERH